MQYYNTVSKAVVSISELMRQENASIPAGLPYGQWLAIKQDPYPEDAVPSDLYQLGPVELRDGEAYQSWVKGEKPAQA
jgi:hypothetical protein